MIEKIDLFVMIILALLSIRIVINILNEDKNIKTLVFIPLILIFFIGLIGFIGSDSIFYELNINKSDIKLGNLDPIRDMTFVKDTCVGFLDTFRSDNFFGEVINIGMNLEVSIEDLAHEIMKIMEVDCPIISDQERIRPDNSEVQHLICNNEKLLNNSCWKPEYTLTSGLSETIDWFRENGSLNKSGNYHI